MRSTIFLLVLFASVALSAAEVTVETKLEADVRGPEVELVAERVGTDAIVRASVVAGSSKTLALERGLWRIRVIAKGLWAADSLMEVADEPATVSLTLLRTTPIAFRIAMPKGEAAPKELNVYFGEHAVACAIDDTRATCELPMGTHDLAFRVPGYVSVYDWERKIAGAPIDLGTLQFRRGTTISGRVDISRTTLSGMRDVEVVLTAAPDADLNPIQRERAALTTVVVRPTPRGFFHAVVTPGAYGIEARAKRHRSERYAVTVFEGREAALRDVLVLEPSRELTVAVTPPLDPTDKPWVLTLQETEGRRDSRSATVSEHGTARFADLFPGRYSLSAGRGDGSSWHTETIDVATQSFVAVSIPLTLVRGEVRLGDRSLRARLRFWDDTRSITVLARESGRFAVDLPLEDEKVWPRIDVEADEPFVRTSLHDVPIERDENDQAFIVLEIASRTITGEIVDETGRRAAPALITVANGDGGVFQIESKDGSFAFEAASTGTVSLTAITQERETAQPYVVAEDAGDIRLVVAPASTFHAVIRSSFGPVLGANVWIAPSLPQPVIALIPTEGDGAVHFRVPPGTANVFVSVAAPGFAHRLLRLPVTREPQQILVSQSGGRLVFGSSAVEGKKPYVLRNGALLPLPAFQYISGGPFVEEGIYALCEFSDEEAAAAYAGVITPNRCSEFGVRRP